MYIDKLALTNIRTFDTSGEIEFVHPDRDFPSPRENGAGRPRLPNVNLLLGDNGSGKTTLLQAVALAAFGPAVAHANLGARHLVRFTSAREHGSDGEIRAVFRLHRQDNATGERSDSILAIQRRGELEQIDFRGQTELWDRVFESKNDAYFIVAYGATRRVEPGEGLDMGARAKSHFLRAQRVQSVFRDSYSLIPLTYWLPELRISNPGRYKEVVRLINRILRSERFTFTEQLDGSDYRFERGGTQVPFQSLSDGYRAFVGWVADLLYHVCFGCPSGERLVDNCGIVLVDEVDLHLHPKWQMSVVETLAESLPRMQFVLTSHSPLIAGSLERTNVIRLRLRRNRSSVQRTEERIHGLDADQILLTNLFGLTSTRARRKDRQLDDLTRRARSGDTNAARELIEAMATGLEK